RFDTGCAAVSRGRQSCCRAAGQGAVCDRRRRRLGSAAGLVRGPWTGAGLPRRASESSTKTKLSPRLIGNDGNAVGQVQAAVVGLHGQIDYGVGGSMAFRRQAAGFAAEQQRVVATIRDVVVEHRAEFAGCKYPAVFMRCTPAVEVGPSAQNSLVVVVESGATQALVGNVEAQRLDQV